MDSLNFNSFYSPFIFIQIPTEKLINFIGKPDIILFKKEVYCSSTTKETVSLMSLYYKKQSLIYWSHNDTARLHNFSLKKCKNQIWHENFCFKRKTKINDVIQYFRVSSDRIDTISSMMVPFKTKRKSKYYKIVLTVLPFKCQNEITLYFNRKEYLEMMFFNILP
jgi:hypothetical protein